MAMKADVVHYITTQTIQSGSHDELMSNPAYRAYWQMTSDGDDND